MKKIHTININDRIYKEFQIYALTINRSVSSLVEDYMKSVVKKLN